MPKSIKLIANGTFDELFEVLTLVQTRKIKPLPIVLVGEAFWRRGVDIDFLVDESVIDPSLVDPHQCDPRAEVLNPANSRLRNLALGRLTCLKN